VKCFQGLVEFSDKGLNNHLRIRALLLDSVHILTWREKQVPQWLCQGEKKRTVIWLHGNAHTASKVIRVCVSEV